MEILKQPLPKLNKSQMVSKLNQELDKLRRQRNIFFSVFVILAMIAIPKMLLNALYPNKGEEVEITCNSYDTIPVKITYYYASGLTYCGKQTENGIVALSPDLLLKYSCGDSIFLDVPETHFKGYYLVSDKTAESKHRTVDVYLNLSKGIWKGSIIELKK